MPYPLDQQDAPNLRSLSVLSQPESESNGRGNPSKDDTLAGCEVRERFVPGRLWSLWEMLEHNAEFFCRLSYVIGHAVDQIGPIKSAPDPDSVATAVSSLSAEAERMHLVSVTARLKRIAFENAKPDFSLQLAMRELFNRLKDELGSRSFFGVEAEFASYMKEDFNPLNEDSANFLPQAVEDMSEAAKCIALNRNTACVFHLMRAMELAVQKLGQYITGLNLDDRKWGTVEEKIRQHVDSLLPLGRDKADYSEVLIHFTMVRKAWRNEVMHPKQTYTKEESSRIYTATKNFLEELTSKFNVFS